jgi:hypothetical protein
MIYIGQCPAFNITIIGGNRYVVKDPENPKVFPYRFFKHLPENKGSGMMTMPAAKPAD